MEVFFQPSATRLKIAHREGDPTTRVLLLRFDAPNTTTTLFPINTMPTSKRFLEPKHAPILSIELVEERGFFNEYDVPKTLGDVEAFLAEGLPSGFTKDPNYGLGLDRNLSFVVHALAKVDGIQKLRLSNKRTLDVAVADNGATYEMGYTRLAPYAGTPTASTTGPVPRPEKRSTKPPTPTCSPSSTGKSFR